MHRLLLKGLASLLGATLSTHVSAQVTTIGALAELSGPYARLGNDCRKAYEVAKRGAPSSVRVVFGDNQSDPKVGISEFRRLVNVEHASIVVSTRSPVGLALNPLSLQQKIPLVGIIGHPRFTAENPYAVRVYPSAADEAEGLVASVRANKETSIGIVTVEDEYFLGLKSAFEASVGKEKIVFSETVATTEQDFATLAARLKIKSPSAIFINVAPSQIIGLLKRIRGVGLNIPIYSNFLVGAPDVRDGLGSLAEGIEFLELDYNKPRFLKALREESGSSDTSPIGYACYVGLTYALQMLEYAAMRKISMLESANEITLISTLDGPIMLRDKEAKFDVVTKVIRNGKVQSVR